MENTKNKNSFLVTCAMCIVLLLVMCYFGVNTSFKGTSAATTSDYVCGDSSKKVITREGDAYCCPTKYTTVTYADGNWYCTSGDDFNIYPVNGGWSCTGFIMQPMGTLDKFIKENYGKDVNISGYIETLTASDMYENIWWSNYTLDGYWRMGGKSKEAVKKHVRDIMEKDFTVYALTKYEKDWGNVDGWTWDYESDTGLTGSGYRDSLYLPEEHYSSYTGTAAGKGQFVVYYHPVVAPLKTGDKTCFAQAVKAKKTTDYACFVKNNVYEWKTFGEVGNDSSWVQDTKYTDEGACEEYTVTFNANGGTITGNITQSVAKNSEIELPAPTREGYLFKGWYDAATDGSFVGKAEKMYKVESSITLYAQWDVIKYTVSYLDPHAQNTIDELKVNAGDKIKIKDCPDKNNYTTLCWYDGEGANSNQIAIPGDENYKVHSDVIFIVRTGYTITLTDGRISLNLGFVDTHQNTINLPSASKVNLTCDAGWYNNDEFIGRPGESYVVKSNVILFAKCLDSGPDDGSGGDTPVTEYTVTYDANGGTASKSSEKAEKDTFVTLPDAVKPDYKFKGWYTAATGGTKKGVAGESYKVTSDVTLYAQWEDDNSSGNSGGNTGGDEPEIKEFIATFEGNGGTVNGKKSLLCTTEGTSCEITIDIPSASRSGYTFKGWSSSSSCTSSNKNKLTLTKDTTFYACYTQNTAPDDDNNNDNNNNGNVNDNPTTGEIAIALTWFIGLVAMGYAMYYFKTVKEN